jgi:hypothetical protein
MPRTYKAVPEVVDAPSAQVAAGLGLPWKSAGLPRLLIGRREWLALPELGVFPIHAKTDSGAYSSSLHAEQISLTENGRRVRFTTHNHQRESITCEADVVHVRRVRSSTGIASQRIFIQTTARLPGGFEWTIRVSLANRSDMRCPMLLGRSALSGYFLIDTQGTHLLGSKSGLALRKP